MKTTVNRHIPSCQTYKMIGQLYVTFQGPLQLFMFTVRGLFLYHQNIPKVRNKTNQTKTRPRNGAPSSRLTRTRTREPLLELDAVVLRLLQRRLEVRGAALRRGLGHVPPHLGAAGDGRGVQSPSPIVVATEMALPKSDSSPLNSGSERLRISSWSGATWWRNPENSHQGQTLVSKTIPL